MIVTMHAAAFFKIAGLFVSALVTSADISTDEAMHIFSILAEMTSVLHLAAMVLLSIKLHTSRSDAGEVYWAKITLVYLHIGSVL